MKSSKLTMLSPESEFEKTIKAADNTAALLNSATKFGVKLLGICARDDRRFPSSIWCKPYQENYFLFAEGKDEQNYEKAWRIAYDAKNGNLTGFPGAAQLIRPMVIQGIYLYENNDWIKLA